MRAEDRTQSRSGGQLLTPRMALVPSDPEAVSVALLRYASNSTSGVLEEDQAAAGPAVMWIAEREGDAQHVTLTQQDGPLRSLVLRFSMQSDDNGATMLWITGEFEPRRSLMRGVLERWQAQREARAVRDSVVAAVTALVEQQAEQAGPALRQSPRSRVRAHVRLLVANHGWIGEVLDVSDGGLAVVIVCSPSHAGATAAFLQQQVGEIELSLPGITERIPVLVRRAQPGRGGLEVGLQVLEAQKMLPLIRKALAQR